MLCEVVWCFSTAPSQRALEEEEKQEGQGLGSDTALHTGAQVTSVFCVVHFLSFPKVRI